MGTKETPTSKGQFFLRRPLIYNLLKISVQKPLTEIIAGAGYGKTQAVYGFIQEYNAIPIWIQLSSRDNLTGRFWENAVNAVSTVNKRFSASLTALGYPDSEITFNRFVSAVLKELQPGKKYILVCDDFHLIYEKSVLQFVERFVNTRIPNFSTILISRNEPQINTIGLFSKNLLSKINEESLRLTEDELGDLFQLRKITLTGHAVSEFYSYTDGWVFAAHLVCLSLKNGIIYRQNPLAAVKLDIYSLLENEVFSVLSDEIKKFLIELSLVESLPLELLNMMSSGRPEFVREVMNIKSFIMFDSYSNTYRIHQLFLKFLDEKQSVLKPQEILEIHKKVARWYADNGYTIDAITHFEKIGYYREIVDILLTYTIRMPKETANFLLNVINRMPEELYEEKPIINVLYAKYLLNNFKAEDAYRKLYEVKEKYEAMPLTEDIKSTLGEVYILLGFQDFLATVYTNAFKFKEYFKIADEYLPLGTKINTGIRMSVGNYTCVVRSEEKGSIDKLIDAVDFTMPFLSRVLKGTGSGQAYLTKAEYAYFKRDLKDAEQNAYQAISKAREKVQYDIENYSIFLLIRINMALGNYSKIIKLIEQQKRLVSEANYAEAYAIHDISSGWFYSTIGQTDKVAEWLKDELTRKEVMSPVTFAPDKLVHILCLLSDNKISEMLAIIDRRSEELSFADSLFGAVEMKVLKAVAFHRIKNHEEAIDTLREAYALAHANSIIMPFIIMGNDMRSLVLAVNDNSIPKEWLENIRKKSSTYAKKLMYVFSEYRKSNNLENDISFNFTNREIDLLTDVCHGLTREEIADNHNLSVNTVKNALQIICEKLGAENTKDAIRIAMSAKLVK